MAAPGRRAPLPARISGIVRGPVDLRVVGLALVVLLVAVGALAGDRPAPPAAVTLWGSGAPPAVATQSDAKAVTLGTAFRATVPGEVVALRYWRSGSTTIAPEGTLWSAAGVLLASARFGSGGPSGWQTVMLSAPVPVQAGEQYVVAYHAAPDGYAVTENFEGTSASSELEVAPGSSGVFTYGDHSAFPRTTWNHSQYWVDVTFLPDAAGTPASTGRPDPSSVATGASESPAALPPAPSPTPTESTPIAAPTATQTPTPSAAPTSKPSSQPHATSSPRPGAAAAPAPTPAPAPVPAPAPAVGGKPGPSNTGVPPGVSLTPATGLTVTTPNQVLDGLDIRGAVKIDAPGVQIRNSRITGSDYYGILVESGSVTVTDTEISGFENAIAGDGWTAVRVNIHSVTGDGVKLGSDVTLQSSWIHDLTPGPGAHADGAQMQDGVTNLVVAGNTIEVSDADNSAIFLSPDLGPSTEGPVTVTGNWLDGGGFTLFCVEGSGGAYVVHNIAITGNRFGFSAAYGPVRIAVPVTFTGNVDTSGAPISF
jgi:hypothetical protein